MVNRFTPKAQLVLTSAKKCAEKMGHSYIGSEHLILGILSCDCMGKRVLEDKRITYSDFYSKLAEIAGTGNEDSASLRELTPKCKKIIESSSLCAKRFNDKLSNGFGNKVTHNNSNDCCNKRRSFFENY